ncbi:PspC domain-containing protein [Paenibacillus sp. KQZ6P-2]|uniref:PspC domain-containing protein n=1 Tax=Paenibacillus mangrovi TaxID=2931978 RepID=A0A9X1WVC2_9BACL|nr:PspC domain-containing protein [Paenibacillus mangrovi]MCJ8015326.1 PspC domain-containing protein [Paenibacillus mangrovi]
MNKNKLKRSSRDKSLNGVCGGIAEFCGISSFGIRLIFILTMPVSLIIYIILSNILDENTSLSV